MSHYGRLLRLTLVSLAALMTLLAGIAAVLLARADSSSSVALWSAPAPYARVTCSLDDFARRYRRGPACPGGLEFDGAKRDRLCQPRHRHCVVDGRNG
ncbi:hypothetical protein AB4Z22_45585, partial [Paenibacillus sp. TAF58]